MSNTWWYCEECRRAGEISLNNECDTWTGVQTVISAHSAASPVCTGIGLQVSLIGPIPETGIELPCTAVALDCKQMSAVACHV